MFYLAVSYLFCIPDFSTRMRTYTVHAKLPHRKKYKNIILPKRKYITKAALSRFGILFQADGGNDQFHVLKHSLMPERKH